MHFIILAGTLLFLVSCGGGRALAPTAADAAYAKRALLPVAPDSDPALKLRAALEELNAERPGAALLVLRSILDHYPNTPWYKRALFLTERTFIRMDLPEESDAAMLRVLAEFPLLADYAVFILAEYHFEKGRQTQAAALYQRVMEQHPKSTLVVRAAYKRGLALLESSAYLQAEEAFTDFLQNHPRSELAPHAALGLGKSLAGQLKLLDAALAYQSVWIRYPGNSIDQEVETALGELKAKGVAIPELEAEDLFERGKTLYRAAQFEKALQTFKMLLEKERSFPRRSDVLFMAGVASFNTNKRTEAIGHHEKMLKTYPQDPRVPEALHWIGKAYSKLGHWDQGVAAFGKLLEKFPESEWADDALFLMGNIYRETGEIKEAVACYGRLSEEYPDSKFADSALWWRAWTHYTEGAYQKADRVLRTLVSRYPQSFLANQARFWQGRAAEELGEHERAIALYRQAVKKGPYTYYGYRAADRLVLLDASHREGEAEQAVEDTVACMDRTCPDDPLYAFDTEDGPPIWTEETKKLLAAEPAFKKTLELLHVDMKKDAAIELWFLQEKKPRRGQGTLIGLSKAFFELGDYHRSIMLVLRKYDRYLEAPKPGTPEDLWQLVYPLAHWESISAYARTYGQDPYFIAAIIREESQFNPQALSPAGARGVMQVMPATGAQVARQIPLKGFGISKLYEAEAGINIGTWYISQLMKRFRGDPLYVAAAYNAGPEAVASWIRKNGTLRDRDVFVESIPYTETRGYVKKVLRNYMEYRRIYGKMGSKALLAPLLSAEGMEAAAAPGEIQTP